MHDAKSRWSLFCFGAFGGILPTLCNLGATYITVPETPPPAIGMLFGLAIMAVVGGGVAQINSTMEIRQAIITGIAAPALLTSFISGATESRRKAAELPAPIVAMVGLFVSSAEAQETASGSKGQYTLVIKPTVNGFAPTGPDIPVTAAVKTGPGVEPRTVQIGTIRSTANPSAFFLPEGTYEAFVGGKPIAITGPLTEANVTVTTRPTNAGDFLWALGGQRRFEVQGVEVASPKK